MDALEHLAPGPEPDAPSVRHLADGIAATLRMARAMVEGQRDVDLQGLDGMIGLLCARALDLPPDQGRALRPRLIELLADVDALAGALAAEPP
jgi:hypothetical protein